MGLLEDIVDHREAGDEGALVDLLEHPQVRRRPGLRTSIALALGQIGGPRAAHGLARLFDDPVRRVRLVALDEAGNTADTALAVPLEARLRSNEKLERTAAAKSLGQLRDRAGLPCLLQTAVSDPDKTVRIFAVRALRVLEAAEAVPALLERLNDSAYAVRKEAFMALVQIRDERADAALREYWRALPRWRRGFAERALRELGLELPASLGPAPAASTDE